MDRAAAGTDGPGRRFIQSLAELLRFRSGQLLPHSLRVGLLARWLGARQAPGDEELADLLLAAGLFHDAGLAGTAERIIAKPGPLSVVERAEMMKHPARGAEIISRVVRESRILLAIRHHHESWCGAGYPDRLQGEEIPREARIVALADAFDAMCSPRPYRPRPLSPLRALENLQEQAGRQFDPSLVALFGQRPGVYRNAVAAAAEAGDLWSALGRLGSPRIFSRVFGTAG